MSKVVKKHQNSKMCFICGLENDKGLKAEFFETEDGALNCIFKPDEKYQSYPGILHGGISASVLDELIGRAMNVSEPNCFSVTTNLELRYKKPVPYGVTLTAKAKITKNHRLLFSGEGIIYDDKGNVCVTAKGKYMKMPVEKIAGDFNAETDWIVYEKDTDPKEICVGDE